MAKFRKTLSCETDPSLLKDEIGAFSESLSKVE